MQCFSVGRYFIEVCGFSDKGQHLIGKCLGTDWRVIVYRVGMCFIGKGRGNGVQIVDREAVFSDDLDSGGIVGFNFLVVPLEVGAHSLGLYGGGSRKDDL